MQPAVASLLMAFAALIVRSASACKTDWDCSLAGTCENEKCICDSWTSGADCSYLRFLPVDKSRLGYLDPNHSSWGGNAILGRDDKWHLFAAEISCNKDDTGKRCGLNNWIHNSQIVHAVSNNPDGPYQRKELVLGQEAHNPTIFVDPLDRKTWHLYSIREFQGPTTVTTTSDEGITWTDPQDISPYCNPGPLLHKDGSMALYYRDTSDFLPKPTCCDESIGLQVCTTPIGPCNVEDINPIISHTAEDPSVFVDQRGNYHMLVNALPGKCVPKLSQGGHAWSADGLHWSYLRLGAYNTTIKFTDGTSMVCERRERPQMMLDADGLPMMMFSGVTNCPKMDEWPDYKGGNDCFTLAQLVPRELPPRSTATSIILFNAAATYYYK